MSIEELAVEIARANGKVFIGFRDSTAAAGVDERGVVLASAAVVATMKEKLRNSGVTVRHEYQLIPAVSAIVSPDSVASLLADSRVEYIEPLFPAHLLAQDTTWNVKRVKADSVWSSATGAGVKLLVIDNGADTSHSDIEYAYVSGGCTGNNGINNDNHGLKVAGVAAAVSNTIGAIGVAPGVSLYSIDASQDGTSHIETEYVACAVEEGIINGMDVINMSIGVPDTLTALTDIINDAYYVHGIVLVGATGNDGNSEPVLYPASLPAVIAVGGTTANNILWTGSHTGPQVEFVAPAAAVPFLCPTAPYYCVDSLWKGTSFAAPHVAAAAALLISYNSAWPAAEIRRRLAVGATDLSPAGRDNSTGYGLLNIKASLIASPPDTASVVIDGPTLVRPFAACSWSATPSGGGAPYTYSWSPGTSSTAAFDYSNTHNHGESFTIVVLVTGADLAVKQENLIVNVSSSAPECPS